MSLLILLIVIEYIIAVADGAGDIDGGQGLIFKGSSYFILSAINKNKGILKNGDQHKFIQCFILLEKILRPYIRIHQPDST